MSEERTCANCGATLQDGAMFCTKCGTKYEEPEQSEQSDQPSAEPSPKCPRCGAELEEDAAFCTECGLPISQDGNGATVVIPTAAPAAATTVMEPTAAEPQYNMPADKTVVAQRPVHPADQTAPGVQVGAATAAPKKKSNKVPWIIAIVVVVIAVLVALAFIFRPAFLFGDSSNSGSNKSSATTSSASTSTSSKSSSSTSSSTATDENEIYSELTKMHSELSTFDSEITTAAQNFNNYNNDSTSLSTRKTYDQQVNTLKQEMESAYESVKDMNVPTSSPNYTIYQNMLTCYSDCVHRIDAISEAWGRSVEFDNPNEHSDYINEPLAQDREGDHNKYKTEFDSVFPNCNPVKP